MTYQQIVSTIDKSMTFSTAAEREQAIGVVCLAMCLGVEIQSSPTHSPASMYHQIAGCLNHLTYFKVA